MLLRICCNCGENCIPFQFSQNNFLVITFLLSTGISGSADCFCIFLFLFNNFQHLTFFSASDLSPSWLQWQCFDSGLIIVNSNLSIRRQSGDSNTVQSSWSKDSHKPKEQFYEGYCWPCYLATTSSNFTGCAVTDDLTLYPLCSLMAHHGHSAGAASAKGCASTPFSILVTGEGERECKPILFCCTLLLISLVLRMLILILAHCLTPGCLCLVSILNACISSAALFTDYNGSKMVWYLLQCKSCCVIRKAIVFAYWLNYLSFIWSYIVSYKECKIVSHILKNNHLQQGVVNVLNPITCTREVVTCMKLASSYSALSVYTLLDSTPVLPPNIER